MTLFDAIYKLLDGDSSPTAAENLDKLIHWCEATISTDLHFEGELQARFDFYHDLALGFLETLQPNVNPAHLTTPLPALNNMTPLEFIVDLGLDIYLKALDPKSEQINTKVDGLTLLQLAAARGNLHTTKALLVLGANPEEHITKGQSILFCALMLPIDHDEYMRKNKQSIYHLLRPYSPNILTERNESGDNLLHSMAVYGYTNLVQEILANVPALASIPNNSTHYPIHAAILNAQHDCAKYLISVEKVGQLVDVKGRNALHYAAKYGDQDMVQICVKSTIGINSVDKRLQTPLILATRANNTEAMKTLLAAGADVNLRDDIHRTALHYAVEENNINMVKILLSAEGIEVNIPDDYSQNPLDLIQEKTPEGEVISGLLTIKDAVHGTAAAV